MPACEFGVPCDKVRVRVRQDHPLDVEAEVFGVVLIVGDVALRVDDRGLMPRADEVGQLGEAAELVLAKDEAAVALFEGNLWDSGSDAVGRALGILAGEGVGSRRDDQRRKQRDKQRDEFELHGGWARPRIDTPGGRWPDGAAMPYLGPSDEGRQLAAVRTPTGSECGSWPIDRANVMAGEEAW